MCLSGVLSTELLKSNKGSVSGELFVRKIDVFTVFPMRFGRSAMLSKTKFWTICPSLRSLRPIVSELFAKMFHAPLQSFVWRRHIGGPNWWTVSVHQLVTKTWNDLKPPKTIYNHLKPPTTTSKNSTTTYNHLQPPRVSKKIFSAP